MGDKASVTHRILTVILNRPLPELITAAAVKLSDAVICADGGANRFVDQIQRQYCQQLKVQDLLSFRKGRFRTIGDMDSIRPDVRQLDVVYYVTSWGENSEII